MPFAAMSCLMRAIVSSSGYALLTLITPSACRAGDSVSAIVGCTAPSSSNAATQIADTSLVMLMVIAVPRGLANAQRRKPWLQSPERLQPDRRERRGSHGSSQGRRLVQDKAFEGIEVGLPRLLLQHATSVRVARVAAPLDARAAEVDVLGVVLAPEHGGQKPDDMHARHAAVGRHLADFGLGLFRLGQPGRQFGHDVAQAMDLLLASNMAHGAAGILQLLL